MGKVFTFSQPLRFGHCDVSGIVALAPFFDIVNASVEDWFQHGLEQPFDAFHLEHGFGNPIVSTGGEFLRACRYGEIMTLELAVAGLGRSSIELQISAKVDGEERMRVRHKTAMIDMDSFRATAIPQPIREKMLQYALEAGVASAPSPRRLPAAHPPANRFRTRRQIRYSDCDSSEIVYFPRFFDVFTAALEDWFAQALGSPWGTDFMGNRNLRMPSLRIACQFLKGCRVGEMLDVDLWLTRLGNSSIDIALAGSVAGEPRLQVAWTLCVIDFPRFESVAIPEDLRVLMLPFLAAGA